MKGKKIIISVVALLLAGGLATAGGIVGKQIVDARQKNSQLVSENQSKQDEIDKYQQQIVENEHKIGQLEGNIKEINSQVRGLEGELKKSADNIVQLNEQLSAKQNELNSSQEQIASLRESEVQLNQQIAECEAEIESLNQNAAENQSEIARLQNDISNLESEKQNLQNSIGELEAQADEQTATINALNAAISSLESTKSENEASIAALQKQVQDLEGTIEDLNKQIANDKQIIEYLKEINTSVVSFTIDGELFATQQVKKTESPNSFDNPSSEDYIFNGWMLAGTTEIIDPFTYEVTQDTEFVANITKYCNVTFKVNEEVVGTQRILSGNKAKNVAIEDTHDYSFVAWQIGGEDVDVTKYTVSEDTEFVARLSFEKINQETYNAVQGITLNNYQDLNQTSNVYKCSPYSDKAIYINDDILNIYQLNGTISYSGAGRPLYVALLKQFTIKFMGKLNSAVSEILAEDEAGNMETIKLGLSAHTSGVRPMQKTYYMVTFTTENYGKFYKSERDEDSDKPPYRENCKVTLVRRNSTKQIDGFIGQVLEYDTREYDTADYKFLGWTVNGEIVDIKTYEIQGDTEFVAKYEVAPILSEPYKEIEGYYVKSENYKDEQATEGLLIRDKKLYLLNLAFNAETNKYEVISVQRELAMKTLDEEKYMTASGSDNEVFEFDYEYFDTGDKYFGSIHKFVDRYTNNELGTFTEMISSIKPATEDFLQ